jgi:hypothetical protein
LVVQLSVALVAMALVVLAGRARAAGPPERTETEQAIDSALEYLQRAQDADGAWRAWHGRKNAAITGLSVMAFLAAGHVPGEGRYAETVEKGIRWVLRTQQANGLIATAGGHEMYHHGICTLMLAEAAGMTDAHLGDEIRHKLAKAVTVILKAQRSNDPYRGGWRYTMIGSDSDISVTGWQIMALRAAKNLGCDVPAESIEAAVRFIERCRDPGSGGFRYQPGSRVTLGCTGTSILALEICGKERHRSPEVLKAGAYILNNPPRWRQEHFFYTVYYAAQATFQLGDNYWSFYRPMLHQVLLTNQKSNGSWQGDDGEGRQQGPSYCTAMAILALTVEYRFLPIYQRGEETGEDPEPTPQPPR